jgi:two-component system LytT family sensor kinase
LVTNPLTYRLNAVYYFAATLSLIFLQIVGLREWLGLPLGGLAIDAILSWLLLALMCFGIVNTLAFFQPTRGRFLMAVMAPLVLAFALHKLTIWLLHFFILVPGYQVFLEESSLYRLSVSYLLMVGATGFSMLWYQLGQKQENERREQETERMAREAELFKLRQQLQPHFLFNSLNSINSLIGSRPKEARKMVSQLSDFLRSTMRRDEQSFISLQEEMEHLRLYLEIEQVRFGHRLVVEIDCAEELHDWKIPPLILQPLLENAIKHGLYGTLDDLIIRLKCRLLDNYLVLSVTNPYENGQQSTTGTGFGLKSVQRRLYLLFGRTDLIEVSRKENIFKVKLKIPKANVQGANN